MEKETEGLVDDLKRQHQEKVTKVEDQLRTYANEQEEATIERLTQCRATRAGRSRAYGRSC